ncbi:hypothetical protein D1007_21652 [Hordeum vulgare]|nr:hypothetical protein D1007_21652 [Hordeum vulgare]
MGMTSQEAVAYTRVKGFCSNIIKNLAPPLLKEVQAAKMRPEVIPLMPKCTTRATKKSAISIRTKESPVENVLLHALGLAPKDLVVDGGVVHKLKSKSLFNSPLWDQHVQTIVGLFGKSVLNEQAMEGNNTMVVC